jgi:hypothetical protein
VLGEWIDSSYSRVLIVIPHAIIVRTDFMIYFCSLDQDK